MFTNAFLKSKKNFPTDKVHKDYPDAGGLLARFYKTGAVAFYYRFRYEGKSAI